MIDEVIVFEFCPAAFFLKEGAGSKPQTTQKHVNTNYTV